MVLSRSCLLVLPAALLVVCCSAPPEPVDTQTTSESTPSSFVGSGAAAPISTVMAPPPPPGTCPGVDPHCSVVSHPWNQLPDTFGSDPFPAYLYQTQECGLPMTYNAGQPGTMVNVQVALCTDSPVVRTIVAAFPGTGIGRDVCDTCLPVAPPGKIYVLWPPGISYRPTCGSSCRMPWI